jgi:hypothetical protein
LNRQVAKSAKRIQIGRTNEFCSRVPIPRLKLGAFGDLAVEPAKNHFWTGTGGGNKLAEDHRYCPARTALNLNPLTS